MVRVQLQSSARLNMQLKNPAFTTTEEDMPPTNSVMVSGFPCAGDYVESDDGSGRSWQVIRTYWTINEVVPIVEVE